MKTLAMALSLFWVTASGWAGDDFKEKMGALEEVEPEADKALVYILRPATMGMGIRIWTFAGQQPLIVTHGKQGGYVYLDPGSYLFWSRAENVNVMELELKAGEVYWIKQKVKMGFGKARTNLVLMSEAEGREALAKCTHVQLTDAGRARASEIAKEKWDVVQKKKSELNEED